MGKIDTSQWGKFRVGELFEKPENTGNILARNVIDGSGDIPYVTASGVNNGVSAHIDASNYKVIKGNCILVGGKTFTMTYQADDFVSNDSHNFTMRLLGEHGKYEYMYVISVLKATLSNTYSWVDAVTADKIVNNNILLPVCDGSGKPDWEYMSLYIRELEVNVNETLAKLMSAIKKNVV